MLATTKHNDAKNRSAIRFARRESQYETSEITHTVRFVGIAAAKSGAQRPTLQIMDTKGHSTTVTGAQLAKEQRVTVNVRDHDTSANFEGVPLSTVLASADIALGDKLRGPRLAEVLLAEASDGY